MVLGKLLQFRSLDAEKSIRVVQETVNKLYERADSLSPEDVEEVAETLHQYNAHINIRDDNAIDAVEDLEKSARDRVRTFLGAERLSFPILTNTLKLHDESLKVFTKLSNQDDLEYFLVDLYKNYLLSLHSRNIKQGVPLSEVAILGKPQRKGWFK